MDAISRSVRDAPIVPMDGYDYLVHPITDCLPRVEPELLESVVAEIQSMADFESADTIVAPEAMGIHLATALSLETRVPFVVVRKRSYGLDGEVAVGRSTGYGEDELFINGLSAGDRVVFVDDMYSSGGTVEAVCSTLLEMGVDLVDVVVVFRRGEIETDLPIEIESLYRLDVDDGRATVTT